MEGFLEKSGGVLLKRPTRRWFVLSGTTLRWYRTRPPASTDGGSSPPPPELGSLELTEDVTVKIDENADDGKYKWSLIPPTMTSPIEFAAENDEIRQQWLIALAQVMPRCSQLQQLLESSSGASLPVTATLTSEDQQKMTPAVVSDLVTPTKKADEGSQRSVPVETQEQLKKTTKIDLIESALSKKTDVAQQRDGESARKGTDAPAATVTQQRQEMQEVKSNAIPATQFQRNDPVNKANEEQKGRTQNQPTVSLKSVDEKKAETQPLVSLQKQSTPSTANLTDEKTAASALPSQSHADKNESKLLKAQKPDLPAEDADKKTGVRSDPSAKEADLRNEKNSTSSTSRMAHKPAEISRATEMRQSLNKESEHMPQHHYQRPCFTADERTTLNPAPFPLGALTPGDSAFGGVAMWDVNECEEEDATIRRPPPYRSLNDCIARLELRLHELRKFAETFRQIDKHERPPKKGAINSSLKPSKDTPAIDNEQSIAPNQLLTDHVIPLSPLLSSSPSVWSQLGAMMRTIARHDGGRTALSLRQIHAKLQQCNIGLSVFTALTPTTNRNTHRNNQRSLVSSGSLAADGTSLSHTVSSSNNEFHYYQTTTSRTLSSQAPWMHGAMSEGQEARLRSLLRQREGIIEAMSYILQEAPLVLSRLEQNLTALRQNMATIQQPRYQAAIAALAAGCLPSSSSSCQASVSNGDQNNTQKATKTSDSSVKVARNQRRLAVSRSNMSRALALLQRLETIQMNQEQFPPTVNTKLAVYSRIIPLQESLKK